MCCGTQGTWTLGSAGIVQGSCLPFIMCVGGRVSHCLSSYCLDFKLLFDFRQWAV